MQHLQVPARLAVIDYFSTESNLSKRDQKDGK